MSLDAHLASEQSETRAVLADPELDRRFARDGYVVIPAFCNRDAVDGLVTAYDELGPAPGDVGEYCHFDFQSADRTYKQSTDRAIRDLLGPALERCFVDYRPYYGNYVMKWPSPTSWFGVHQDSCFVDETRAVSASIWVPTVDVDEHNGAVWFFPGSHRIRSTIRGSNQRVYSFQEVAGPIEERCGQIVRIAAGDAIVFDHRVVHWSYANFGDQPRLAAVLGVIPEDHQLLHHHASDDGVSVETFAIDDQFFIDNDPFGSLLDGLITYPSLRAGSLAVDVVSETELDEWLAVHPVEADTDLAAELRQRTEDAAAAAVLTASENRGTGAPGPQPSRRADPAASDTSTPSDTVAAPDEPAEPRPGPSDAQPAGRAGSSEGSLRSKIGNLAASNRGGRYLLHRTRRWR